MIVMAGNLPPPLAGEGWGGGQYLLASKKLPQAWHLHCIVITWLPNREITSVSFDRQNGHRALPRSSLPPCGVNFPPPPAGEGRGGGLSTCRHVPLFREALQHLDVRVFRTDPLQRVPPRPLERGAGVHLLHPAPAVQRVVALLLKHLLEPRS